MPVNKLSNAQRILAGGYAVLVIGYGTQFIYISLSGMGSPNFPQSNFKSTICHFHWPMRSPVGHGFSYPRHCRV